METLRKLKKLTPKIKQVLNLHSAIVKSTFVTKPEEAIIPTNPYVLFLLKEGPESGCYLTKTDALKYFQNLATIRKMETKINALYKAQAIRGFCHLYSGQEAVAVGIHSAMRPQDTVITSYRCHAWAFLVLGKDSLLSVLSELMGLSQGCCKGKGGSMHMYGKRLFGGQAIVGAQVPLGVGVALSYKYTKKDAISVTCYGDGAANNGQVMEAMNMAALWQLPCIFVCENNRYSMGTSLPRSSANQDLYTKGEVIPAIKADGMDFFSMREAAKFAVNHCKAGKGPILIEASTYRYSGHSLSDPGTSYRTRHEVEQVRKDMDPINGFKEKILKTGMIQEDEMTKIDHEAKKQVDDLAVLAMKGKEIPVEELTCDLHSDNDKVVKEVRLPKIFTNGIHKTTGRLIAK